MKKIVIVPIFCETHLVKYQIPNIIDTINPDVIIYNEGMFPVGPESCTRVSSDFLEKYTLDGEGKRGFDYPELKKVVQDAQEKYKNVKIILNEMNYTDNQFTQLGQPGSATNNYVLACTNFEQLGVEVKEGDYIFPYEGDVFHHEDSAKEIEGYMKQLEPNQGFRSTWIDFCGNQYYGEKSSLKPFLLEVPGWAEQGRSRKICIRFGDMETYKEILQQFEKNNYPMLFPTDLVTYHYAWWRPDKYADLRCAQLNREFEPGYWDAFIKGLNKTSERKYLDIDVRPLTHEEHLTYRYLSFYDIEHPKHIKEHICYEEELSVEEKNMIKENKLRFMQ